MYNKPVSKIATSVGLSRESVYANIDKALALGIRNDWVLVLDDFSRKFGIPGVPLSLFAK
jgi:DNA-binding Lrp family transcriptional regulator